MVNAVVPLTNEKPATFGWLQFEKKAIGELQKLAMTSPAAMGTLMYMVNHMSRSNALVVSQKAIAEGVGTTRETVNKAIRYLAEHNFLQILKAGGATVYVVNSRVAWQGERGARYAAFGADVIAIESEQDRPIDGLPALKPVPVLHEDTPPDHPSEGDAQLS